MHIVIFTSPSVTKGEFVTQAIKEAHKIFAADSGALAALSIDVIPEVVVGDFDSLDAMTVQTLQEKKVFFVKNPTEKDEVDTQLAIDFAIQEGATKITLVGGLEGNRIDHMFGNMSLTYNPKVPIKLVNGPSALWVVLGPAGVEIDGDKDDLLSLIPLSQVVTHVKTEGLYYPLLSEPLYFGRSRGLSNIFAEKKAAVSIEKGMLLFVHTNAKELEE